MNVPDGKIKNWITMEQVFEYSQRLHQQINNKEFDWYVAVSRGGLFTTGILSYMTGIKQIEVINPYLRLQNNYCNHLKYLKGKRVLVIDTICDKGFTFEKINIVLKTFEFKDLKYAALIKLDHSGFYPDYIGKVLPSDHFLSLPWEFSSPERSEYSQYFKL